VSEDSRSEAIRRLLEGDPGIKTATVLKVLRKEGIEVSANLVKVVRHNWKEKRQAQERMKAREKERRRSGLEDMPVGGKRRKTNAEIDAEVEEMLNRFSEE